MQHDGSYIFDSNNTIGLYGYIYEKDFNPFDLRQHSITESILECDNIFRLAASLHINVTYILVVTTLEPNKQGPFTVFISGPDNVTINRIGEYTF